MSFSTSTTVAPNATPTTTTPNADKWVARTERLAGIMASAKRQAEIEHAAQKARRAPSKKPSRAVTKRQQSSKRSAEICRVKMGIYITKLEEENQKEVVLRDELEDSLLRQTQANTELLERITQLSARKRKNANTESPVVPRMSAPSSPCVSEVTVVSQASDGSDLQMADCSWKTESTTIGDLDADWTGMNLPFEGIELVKESLPCIEDFDQFVSTLESPVPVLGENDFMDVVSLVEDSISTRRRPQMELPTESFFALS